MDILSSKLWTIIPAAEGGMADENIHGDTGPQGPMPRWVKVSLIAVGVLIAVFLVLNLTGHGGGHGPGRHLGPAGDHRSTPSSDVDYGP
jgi:hypothetical protein